MSKWIVVGATPIQTYTGTTTYAGIHQIALVDSEKDAARVINENYEEYGGMIESFEIPDKPLDNHNQ